MLHDAHLTPGGSAMLWDATNSRKLPLRQYQQRDQHSESTICACINGGPEILSTQLLPNKNFLDNFCGRRRRGGGHRPLGGTAARRNGGSAVAPAAAAAAKIEKKKNRRGASPHSDPAGNPPKIFPPSVRAEKISAVRPRRKKFRHPSAPKKFPPCKKLRTEKTIWKFHYLFSSS